MKGDVFLSNEEYRQKQDLIRNRQQRLIQVREQSKEMAAAILNRMKQEAEMQYQQTENRVLSEIRQHYSRELANIRQHYHQCISDINQQHYIKHIDIRDSSNIKKKNGSKTVNLRQNEKMKPKPDTSKKSDFQNKVDDKNRETLNPVEDKINTHPSTSPSLTMKKHHYKNKKILFAEDSVPSSENVAVTSDRNNIKSSKVNTLPEYFKPPPKKIGSPKKSVMFISKENCDSVDTSTIKRYPAYAKKPTNLDLTRCKMFDPNLILSDIHVQHDPSEMYNRLVHDRIRVLEQKEKILRRRSPIPSSMSNLYLNNKPLRFSEYFCKLRDPNISFAMNKERNDKIQNEVLEDEINKDLNRVEIKKKLLLLELSNAETQTEPNISSNTSVESNLSVSSSKENAPEIKESHLKSVDLSKNSTKNSYPSPIPKNKEVLDNIITDMKKIRSSKNRLCKRRQVRNKAVTVTVSSNQTGISTNSTDSSSSTIIHNYTMTKNSLESDDAVNQCDSHKTVKIVVNVLSNSEYKEKPWKASDKNKSVAYVIPANNFKKTPNWRKLFNNDEKMTESSYFSPPDMVLEKPDGDVNHLIEPKELPVQSMSNEKTHDLGYYVKKLLLMRPESIEKLDISSCSTVTIDDLVEKNDGNIETKNRIKMPLYQNSFDEIKVLKKSSKLPYYQNSFDDTADVVREFTSNSHRYNSAEKYDVSSLVEDESVDISSSSSEQKFLSSMSDSSKYPIGNSAPQTSTCRKSEKPLNESQYVSNSAQTNFYKSKNLDKNANNVNDEDLKLPTVEELLKRGFISELILDQKSAGEEEALEEEEFLKHLLTVNIKPENELKELKSGTDIVDDLEKSIVYEKPLKESDDKMIKTVLNTEDEMNKILCDARKENRLLGWIGATVHRTLQASAINSTSSGDSSDPVRQTYKNLENLTEEPFENSPESDSVSFSKHFTLSPIKVPDIHFSVLPTSKNL